MFCVWWAATLANLQQRTNWLRTLPPRWRWSWRTRTHRAATLAKPPPQPLSLARSLSRARVRSLFPYTHKTHTHTSMYIYMPVQVEITLQQALAGCHLEFPSLETNRPVTLALYDSVRMHHNQTLFLLAQSSRACRVCVCRVCTRADYRGWGGASGASQRNARAARRWAPALWRHAGSCTPPNTAPIWSGVHYAMSLHTNMQETTCTMCAKPVRPYRSCSRLHIVRLYMYTHRTVTAYSGRL